MTGADLAFIAAVGLREDGTAALQVLGWLIAVLLGIGCVLSVWLLVGLAREMRRAYPGRYERPAPPCPCCTGRPMEFSDCTCREPCGETWCQAADPPECPWCDTHECIDRTLCICRAACGSWLCEAKEESRG